MNVHPIRTREDHAAALASIDELWGAEPGAEAADRLDVLLALVEHYEDRVYPAPRGIDPIDALLFLMSENDRTQKDLAELFGSRSRASEVLKRRRPLTLDQIRLLHAKWGVPAECLLGDPVSA
jgi:HTH-type transcriptional regulator/antitoxin HigA